MASKATVPTLTIFIIIFFEANIAFEIGLKNIFIKIDEIKNKRYCINSNFDVILQTKFASLAQLVRASDC